MRCERAQELFSDYCEGQVQRALMVPLESHLASCASCREQVGDLREVWRVLDAAPLVEPPAGFRAAVWQRIDAEEDRKRQASRPRPALPWRALFTRPALGWAAALLLVFLLAGIVIPGRYTGARPWFPWSLFYSAPAAQPVLALGDLQARDGASGRQILLPIRNTGVETVTVRVSAVAGPARLLGYTVDIAATPGMDRTVEVLTYAPAAGEEPLRLRATWKQDGQVMSKTYLPR